VNEDLENRLQQDSSKLQAAIDEMSKKLVGQQHVAKRLMMSLIAQGHVLLEGLPGLAKTTAIKTLGQVCSLDFRRVQFTPDLLPADILGTQVYDPKSGDFRIKKGPIFTHLLLADEINRAPAKVQSALLEAMQEKQVTLGEETFKLQEPFLVMATQNPIEQEGTYSLPEAQIDRFLFKLLIRYGSMEEEQEIVAREHRKDSIEIHQMMTCEDILHMRQSIRQIHVADKVRKYLVNIVFVTRDPAKYGLKDLKKLIEYGASPRASINLEIAARIHAMMDGRLFVTPQDVKDIGLDVLRHRLILSYASEAEGITADDLIQRIFDRLDVP